MKTRDHALGARMATSEQITEWRFQGQRTRGRGRTTQDSVQVRIIWEGKGTLKYLTGIMLSTPSEKTKSVLGKDIWSPYLKTQQRGFRGK